MALMFATLSLSACGSVVQQGVPLAQVQDVYDRNRLGDTRISPLDSIEIKFMLHPEFNETVLVPLNGFISLALADRIEAAGKTPRQLAEAIKGAYRNVMRDPVVSVQVRTAAALKTFVGGEVALPGAQLMTSPLTVVGAIMAAGGFKPTARTGEVVVLRQTADGGRMVFSVDVDKVLSGADTANDIPLQPLDVVFVPRSDAANVAFNMEQYFRNVLPLPTTASVGAYYNAVIP